MHLLRVRDSTTLQAPRKPVVLRVVRKGEPMTRRWIAFLFGGAAAAQQKAPTLEAQLDQLPFGQERIPRIPKPKNGECPVCGVRAERWIAPVGPSRCLSMEKGTTYEELCRLSESVRMVACRHCNNIFRQFVEKEPKR